MNSREQFVDMLRFLAADELSMEKVREFSRWQDFCGYFAVYGASFEDVEVNEPEAQELYMSLYQNWQENWRLLDEWATDE